jgi:lysophospholipase L1-like esterase
VIIAILFAVKKRLTNLSVNILLLLTTVVLFFLGGEILLRVTGVQQIGPTAINIYQKSDDPDISYRLLPNLSVKAFREIVTTDQHGFRSRPIDPKKPSIAVLGDSVTFGYGLRDDQTIPAIVASHLPSYNVINAGVPGYHLGQELALYRKNIAPLKPSVLVVVFFPNDLNFDMAFLDDQGILRSEGWTPGQVVGCDPITKGILGLLPGKCFLDLHSAFYKFVKKIVNMRSNEQQLKAEQEKSRTSIFDDNATPEKLARYDGQLGALAAMLPSSMPRLFVIWPDRDLHFVSRPVLARIAEKRGFKVLDLYQIYGNRMETLGWDTLHPSAAAVSEAGKTIADVLRYWKMVK